MNDINIDYRNRAQQKLMQLGYNKQYLHEDRIGFAQRWVGKMELLIQRQFGQETLEQFLQHYDGATLIVRAFQQDQAHLAACVCNLNEHPNIKLNSGPVNLDIARLLEGLGTPQQRAHDIARFTGMDPNMAFISQGVKVDGMPAQDTKGEIAPATTPSAVVTGGVWSAALSARDNAARLFGQ
jgi:hypothetical protein